MYWSSTTSKSRPRISPNATFQAPFNQESPRGIELPVAVFNENMAARRVLNRVLFTVAGVALAVTLLLFLFIQIEQHVARHRAQRLLADFHSIRLRQSTWQDAQALMQKWHDYGETDGACNESECAYGIELKDSVQYLLDLADKKWPDNLIGFHAQRALERLGAHRSELQVGFIVQDGKIVRSSTAFVVQVPFYVAGPHDLLGVEAQTRSVLRADRPSRFREDWAYGYDEQLADHPDYKASSAPGCIRREGCEMAEVTYTPFLAPSEIERLTSFNLDCMTRLRSCTTVEDMLPAAKPWDLSETSWLFSGPAAPQLPPHACTTTPRVLGRDKEVALEVEAISTETKLHPASPYTPAESYETSAVKLLRVLKGPAVQRPGETLTVRPFAQTSSYGGSHLSEHLLPHHRYIVLSEVENFHKEENVINSNWCGVIEDTPSALAAVLEGASQVDVLRRSEHVR